MYIFSLNHLIYLIICIAIVVAFYFIFRSKSERTKYIATFIPLVIAFVVHFLKIFISPYRDNLPASIISLTPETFCAFSTLFFPFIYISKNKILKDFMVIIGIISGALTLLIPLDIVGMNPWNLETIRFFFAHLAIFISSFFMLVFKIHKLTKKWIKHTILLFLLVGLIVTSDDLLMHYLILGKEATIEYLKERGVQLPK